MQAIFLFIYLLKKPLNSRLKSQVCSGYIIKSQISTIKRLKKASKKFTKKHTNHLTHRRKKITAKKRIKQKRTDQTASRKISVRLFFCGKYLKRCIVLPKSLYLITPRLCRSRYQFAQQMSSEAVKLSAVRFFAADQRSRKTECRA